MIATTQKQYCNFSRRKSIELRVGHGSGKNGSTPHFGVQGDEGGHGKKAGAPNEFYQKGCQEKSSASTGGEMFSRDPAHWN
jgi:hypothetical protein